MNTKNIVDNLIEGIKFYVNEKLKIAPYDKTDTAIVVGASEFGYYVRYNGKIYQDVKTIGGICSINESVKILIPQNNLNNMFIVKGSTNHDIIDVQEEINQLDFNKLNKTGDSSNTTATFTESGTRVNILSGENLSTIFGKIKKWFTDLKAIAFSGLASDLTQDPTHRLVSDTEKTDWNNKAPQDHASTDVTYGIGTSLNYGHIKLSDNYTSSSGNADSGVGASSKGLYDLYNYVNVNSKELNENVTIYVSTTGSDETGNGSSGNPFKTIQYAIGTLPKNLGGFTVIINVADGTYPEVVNIIGFTNGEFRLYSSNPSLLSDNCRINQINARYNTCLLVVGGFSIMATTADGIFADSCPSLNFQFMKITENAISQVGISLYRCIFSIWNCQVSYHNVALLAYNSRGVSNNWVFGAGNNYGLYSSYGSTITLLGNQPAANTPYIHDAGGSFVSDNGTQISGVYTSGLSCTWGTIQGGYIINGIGGVATVTVVATVILSTNLSTGTAYYISGFPRVAGVSRVSVSVHDKRDVYYCFINSDGTLQMVLDSPLVATAYLVFNCTYMTDQQ